MLFLFSLLFSFACCLKNHLVVLRAKGVLLSSCCAALSRGKMRRRKGRLKKGSLVTKADLVGEQLFCLCYVASEVDFNSLSCL